MQYCIKLNCLWSGALSETFSGWTYEEVKDDYGTEKIIVKYLGRQCPHCRAQTVDDETWNKPIDPQSLRSLLV
jgi:hypothetical protein